VMATRPATAPEAAPSIEALPLRDRTRRTTRPARRRRWPTKVLMKASAGHAVGLEVGAGVEAEPAHPQQRRADHGQRQAVRRHRLACRSPRACPACRRPPGRRRRR
jgi:hypothetical protein